MPLDELSNRRFPVLTCDLGERSSERQHFRNSTGFVRVFIEVSRALV